MFKKKIICIGTAAVLFLAMALPVLANSGNYAWKMPWDGYYVSGWDNGVTYNLTAGNLTFSGSVWQYEEKVGAFYPPYSVTTEVWRDDPIWDTKIGSYTVTPSTTLNDKKSFSKNLGSIIADTYYIVANKQNTDGWSTAGSGTLKSQ